MMQTAFPLSVQGRPRTSSDYFIISLGIGTIAFALGGLLALFLDWTDGGQLDWLSVETLSFFSGLIPSSLLMASATTLLAPTPDGDLLVNDKLYEERDHFLHELTKTLPDIVYVYDLDRGRLVYLNDRVKVLLGYEPSELMGLGRGLLETFLHPDDLESAPRWFAKVSDLHKDSVLEHKFRVRHKNGEWRWLESREVAFERDPSGRLVQIMAVANDITDRKNIEETLIESRERNSSILKALPDLMFVQDTKGKFLDYHARDPNILFAPPSEFLGKNMREVIPSEILGPLLERFEAAVLCDDLQALEYKAFVLGEERAYECRIVRSGADKILSIIRDITEQTRTSDALADSEARFAAQYRGIPIPTYTLRRENNEFVVQMINDAALGATLASDDRAAREYQGMKAIDVFDPSSGILTLLERCFNENSDLQQKVGRNIFRNGPDRVLKIDLVPVPPDLVMLFVDDITGSEENLRKLDEKVDELSAANKDLRQAREQNRRSHEELRLSHLELSRESERYRQLFEFAPGGYLTSDIHGVVFEANQAASELLESDSVKLEGGSLSTLVIDKDKKRFTQFLQELQSDEAVHEIEFSMDGTTRIFYAAIKAVRVLVDGLSTFRWLIQDVTARRLTEEALQKSEQFNRTIIDSSNDSITILDLSARIIFMNPRGIDRFESRAEDLFGKVWFEFWSEAERVAAEAQFNIAKAGGIGRFQGSTASSSGKVRWWDVAISPMTDPDGRIARLVVVSRDVTDQKEAEEKLQKKENFFRSLVENAHDLVTVMSYDAKILYESPASERTLGFSVEEKLGKSCLEYLHPDDRDRVLKELSELVEHKAERKTLEYRYRHKNGNWVPLEVFARLSTAENGEPIIIVNKRDITERRQKEAQLRKLVARLLSVQDDERRRLARELHDETAQNLALLDINLAMIEKELAEGSNNVEATISQSRTLIERSLREVRTISYLLHPPMLDEAGLSTALSWLIRGFSDRSRIHVTLDCPERNERFSGDIEIAVYRIVQEALTNIHRHSGSKTAQVRLQRKGDSIILTIEDQGCGIPDAVIGKPAGDVGSLGVGIPGRRERLHLLGGRLDVRSDATGTSLMAVLPLV